MTLNYQNLMSMDFPEQEFAYSERDTQLYALGVGLGQSLPQDLPFVYEKELQVLPTQATVIAWDDTWQDQTGMTISEIVHGGQRITMHRALRPAARIKAKLRIVEVIDKGEGRGALILAETRLRDADGGEPIATLLSTVFARADGGFGGPSKQSPAPHQLPDRAPDFSVATVTRPEQALIYRLSGDMNPLHVDPDVARAAGFEKPILQGLCTYGIAGAALVKAPCDGDASRLVHIEARFTAPVIPGDTLVTEIWQDGDELSFRTLIQETGAVALNFGKALIRS